MVGTFCERFYTLIQNRLLNYGETDRQTDRQTDRSSCGLLSLVVDNKIIAVTEEKPNTMQRLLNNAKEN